MADKERISKNQTLAIMTASLLAPDLRKQLEAKEKFQLLISNAMNDARAIYKYVMETNE